MNFVKVILPFIHPNNKMFKEQLILIFTQACHYFTVYFIQNASLLTLCMQV